MYRDVVEEEQVGSLTVRVMYDNSCPNPRTENDNLGTMLCYHKRYDYGDKKTLSLEEAKKLCNSKDQISLPIFLYDHGGQALSTDSFVGRAPHAEWDSGMIGWITVSKAKIAEEFGWKIIGKVRREKIMRWLDAEVEEYNQWIQGQCYFWEIFNAQDESLDLMTGYIGEPNIEFALTDGVNAAREILAKEEKANDSKAC